ncbi:hypothetical protein KSS87_018351, partial [Heliosperma pusillum]
RQQVLIFGPFLYITTTRGCFTLYVISKLIFLYVLSSYHINYNKLY